MQSSQPFPSQPRPAAHTTRARAIRAQRGTWLLAVLAVAIAGGLQAHPQSPREKQTQLQRFLERYPQADRNRDGELTLEEARSFRAELETRRKEVLKRRDGEARNRPPTHADVRYGPHERNVFDVWLPDDADPVEPRPVFVYFHGGGFVGGDKSRFDPTPYLDQGYAVVSSNYRFVDGAEILAPIPMQDCARALQFLRFKAKSFGIDPARVALSGGSAGAVITMWIAYKDDLAEPDSEDPVARMSTRVSCIVPIAGPTNLDPDWIHRHLGGPPEVHSSLPKFYGIQDGDFSQTETRNLIAESSPIHHATADDPPTMLIYAGRLDNLPLPENAPQGLLIHHPYFGKVLKDKLDKLGVACEFQYGNRGRSTTDIAEFLARHLKP